MSISNSIFRIGSYLIAFLFLHGFIHAQGNGSQTDSISDRVAPMEAQEENETIIIRTESEFGYSPRMKRSVFPVKPIEPSRTVIEHPRKNEAECEKDSFGREQYQNNDASAFKTNAGIQVNIGRSFEGNHLMPNYTPSDNNMAISNDGHIVAIDNRSFAYFKENGDTVVKFSLPFSKFYNDSTMNDLPFDPRVIYDSYEDRFIAITVYTSLFYSDARILLSFSNPLIGDSVTWNHYEINCDSIFTNPEQSYYWFDYPNIAVTKSQFILTVGVVNQDTSTGIGTSVGNAVFQMDKSQGYAGAQNVPRRVWKDVQNTEGKTTINIVPAMAALQSALYDTTCYLVSSYKGNSSKFFWFELKGDMYSPTTQLVARSNFPGFFYSVPSFASQMGGFGTDRISVIDCDIQYCLYQNRKLHFVFTRSDNGWAELVYANIDISANAFSASTFSQATSSLNCLRPSFASFGQDSTDENFMVAFLRTGPSIFPEICVTNFDSGWSAVPTVVKAGLGIIDKQTDLVAPWDTLERWGDYTSIQRRYNDPFKRCWLVGAYPFGPNPNHFGAINSVNAWIAEVGDTLPAIGTMEVWDKASMLIFPNPVTLGGEVTIQLPKPAKYQILVCDALGKTMLSKAFSGNQVKFSTEGLATGMYFVTIIQNKRSYESPKIIVVR